MDAAQLKHELKNFTGTETWFRHTLFRKFLYTEGVQFLAENAECYWLIDKIFGAQFEHQTVRDELFQTWDLTVQPNGSAILQCGDGNDTIVHSETLTFTTFPMDTIRLFLTDDVLLLPTEY